MASVPVNELKQHIGKQVELRGWLYNRRGSGKLLFLQFRDGTGLVQVVVGKADVPEPVFETARRIGNESSIIITGLVKEDTRSSLGVEVQASDLHVIQEVHDYPIQITEDVPNIDKLLDQRHLWVRSRRPHAILRVRSEVIQAIRDFYYNKGYVLFDAPMFTPASCEGTSTLFEVPYFDSTAYLSQSGQLYGEAGAMAFGKVVVFGPTFRAEKSKTRRHLTEFWMVEPEVAFLELDGVMDLAEEQVRYVVGRALERCKEDLKVLQRDTTLLEQVARPFPRVSYDDVQVLLQKLKAEYAASSDPELQKLAKDILKGGLGDDLGAADETAIGLHFKQCVMIHRYPRHVKAFYMKKDPQNAERALCVDVIAPEGVGEIIGGSQREDSLEELLSQIEKHKIPMESINWFVDLRRYGSVPHGGFGMGVERCVQWITGCQHVRETIPFPRTIYRLNP
ncbi:MAG: asparagine--tRNA ligase [Planctomycetes bacterium]|jgi:asparaginyl-tRNA synthetase|nr:asparagine--tRNA ligase [Planctomycetota bacterium]